MAIADSLTEIPAETGRLMRRLADAQRKAQRQKDALARLNTTLARTKHHLQEKTVDLELAKRSLALARQLLWAEAVEEAGAVLEETLAAIQYGNEAARQRTLAAARKRDQALFTLRAQVSQLHRDLEIARGAMEVNRPMWLAP